MTEELSAEKLWPEEWRQEDSPVVSVPTVRFPA
jgi:hypothetical protein